MSRHEAVVVTGPSGPSRRSGLGRGAGRRGQDRFCRDLCASSLWVMGAMEGFRVKQ